MLICLGPIYWYHFSETEATDKLDPSLEIDIKVDLSCYVWCAFAGLEGSSKAPWSSSSNL